MTDFSSALRTELKELTKELKLTLQADPRYRRLRLVRDLLAEYDPKAKVPTLFDQLELGGGADDDQKADLTSGSKEERVKAALRALLKEKGEVHRKDMLEHLKVLGLMGKEKDPMQSLAIYLVGWKDDFESDGAGNYSLKN